MTLQPNPGDILIFSYRDRRFMARCIAAVTGSRYTHAGTYLGDGQVGEACGDGYRVGSLDRYRRECDSIRALPFPGSTDQAAKAVDWCRAQVEADLTYGWLDVIALGLARYGIKPGPVLARLRTPRTAFCSQACMRAWRFAGIDVTRTVGKPDHEVTPADLGDVATIDVL